MPALHVLMVTFASSFHLGDCLASLPPAVTTITVVDNASPGADEQARLSTILAADPRVRLHRSTTNAGFGAGINAAARLVQPRPDDILWLLNPDTVVAPGATERLVEALDEGVADLVSPVVMTGAHGDLVWFRGGDVDTRRGRVEHADFRRPAAERSLEGELMVSPFLSGAALMLTAGTFASLGGLREDLFLYWEDVDLSLAAAAAGLRMAVVLGAQVWHAEGASSRREGDGGSAIYYRWTARNRIVVSSDHRVGRPWSLVLGPGTAETARLLARALVRERRGRTHKAAEVVAGTWAGLRAARSRRRWTGWPGDVGSAP